MLAIHFICGRDDGLNLNGVRGTGVAGSFYSGQWDVSEDEAQSLVSGWFYLHPTKAAVSVFGGVIQGYERVVDDTLPRSRRTVFLIKRRREGDGQRWRGKRHAMAYSGGAISADLPHERQNMPG